MSKNEYNEEEYFEIPSIERLFNIPIVDQEKPLEEIFNEFMSVQQSGKGGGKKGGGSNSFHNSPKHPISEYVSFRDKETENSWGVLTYCQNLRPLMDAAAKANNCTQFQAWIHLYRYFTKRETFHFYVDRAVYGLENLFYLHTGRKHDFWKTQNGNRPYSYSNLEIDAAEQFAWRMKLPDSKKVFSFLNKSGHISSDAMNRTSKHGTHRELNSMVLSDYLSSGCSLDDRIVGIEGLLGLDDEGKGGVASIKLSQTDKRELPITLPFRFFHN
jgi:hypothetical protein